MVGRKIVNVFLLVYIDKFVLFFLWYNIILCIRYYLLYLKENVWYVEISLKGSGLIFKLMNMIRWVFFFLIDVEWFNCFIII